MALNYKLWGIDQLFQKKCAAMDRGLFDRMRRIAEALYATGMGDLGEIEKAVSISFTRNMPRDLSADVETAVKLNGIVSSRTTWEMLEPVTGVSCTDEEERSCFKMRELP